MEERMDFSKALEAAKAGQRIQRAGWNGKDLTVQIHKPESEMNLPFLYIQNPDGRKCPWHPSQTDILAEDWSVLPSFKLQEKQTLFAYKNSHGRVTYSESRFDANQYQRRAPELDKVIQ